jgi:hypothetical protein
MQFNEIKQNNAFYSGQHIFLLSHMRANTSLISHILGSHPKISGYYEMHLSYCSEDDLEKQKQELLSKDIIKSNSQYLFDKILHNRYKFLLEQFLSKKIIILVSIRPPEQTIKSIINLFSNKKNAHPYADAENATQYYIDRIRELAKFCERFKKHYYYYDADLIRKSPEETLSRIQKWLLLETPLTEQYQIFSQTGKPRRGDSSDNMKKGRIVKLQTNYKNIDIAPHLLIKAEAEINKLRPLILAHAIELMV